MRFFIHIILLMAIAVGLGFIALDRQQTFSVDVVDVRGDIAVKMNVFDREGNQKKEKIAGELGVVDTNCFVWGAFDTKSLSSVNTVLVSSKLMPYAQMVDRFEPDRWIVYLGRFNNETAVRAFMKQFRQQGFSSVRPILQGNLAYGVELAAFESRRQAEDYLNSPKIPDVQGLRVVNRLGDPSDKVDIVFQGLDDNARDRLFREWKKRPGTTLENCGFYKR